MLATIGLSVRTLIGLVSGSTFAYFIQPIATTVVLAVVFAGSVLIGRPVIGRFASDFCELAPEITDRPRVVRLFRGLTWLWAGVHIVTSAATFGMLISLPTATYVLLKTAACLGITVSAIVLTVTCSIRTARTENLVFATVAGLSQSPNTARLCSMKNVWSWPLFGSLELYFACADPSGTCSSE